MVLFLGQLKYQKNSKPKNLKQILMKKYKWPANQAAEFSDFLIPMLHLDQSKRASAEQSLKHHWLQ